MLLLSSGNGVHIRSPSTVRGKRAEGEGASVVIVPHAEEENRET